MRIRSPLIAACALFVSPSAASRLAPAAAATAPQPPNVPGRAGRRARRPRGRRRHVRAGRGRRGRQAGPLSRRRGRRRPGAARRRNAEEQKGVWLPGGGGRSRQPPRSKTCRSSRGRRRVLADRRQNQLEPHTRCKPSGVARQFLTPYGVEFVELPELQRIYIFDIGGPHTYRHDLHGRPRRIRQNLTPSYYGHSIGWWEGDTLVVDTIGFNESFWLDRAACRTPSSCTRSSGSRAPTHDDAIRSSRSTIRAPTRPWNERLQPALGSRTSSSSSTCASRRTTRTS